MSYIAISLSYNIEMRLREIVPLTPQERAERLGLDPSCFQRGKMSEEAESAVNYIKRKDRSDYKLNQWQRKQYAKTDATYQLFECPDEIERRNIETLTLEQFTQRYEKTCTPVIITGCTDSWAIERWNHGYFLKEYSNSKFKVGQDDDGFKLRLPFIQYMEYLLYNQDDSPLYLFESSLQDKEQLRQIIHNYEVPPYFKDDLFRIAGEKRPPFRWLIMGAERSGTTVHIDPLLTSAWNASLRGHKRWVLFGQNVPKSIVKGREFRGRDYDDEAINYFVQILPKIREKYSKQTLKVIQFIQGPGEVVFVPGGLWHAVLNLDDTIAVTQNVMTHYCFDKVWRSTRCQRKKFSETFLEDLKQQELNLYERALTLNEEDHFEMGKKYCQQQVSLSFTPSSSSSCSSSSSSDEPDSDSESSEVYVSRKNQNLNRVNVHQRMSKLSGRSSSSQSRSRDKRKPRVTFSQEKKPMEKRRLSLGTER